MLLEMSVVEKNSKIMTFRSSLLELIFKELLFIRYYTSKLQINQKLSIKKLYYSLYHNPESFGFILTFHLIN
jgi:hypothetical protein